MKIRRTLAVIAAACLAGAAQADVLPAGSLITGQVGGAATALLGLDHGFADEAGSNVTALSAGELEYLTGDFAVGVDFFTDGRVQVWNNSGTALLPGSYALSFDLAGGPALAGFEPLGLAGVSLQLLGPHRIGISFSNLDFGGEFGSFTAQLQASAVPEPGSLSLMGLGLSLLALRRARRAA